jgi:hypothetical protein
VSRCALRGQACTFTVDKSGKKNDQNDVINAAELLKLMQAKPFVPFKVRMSDGSAYEVPNHEAALATRNWLEIGTDLGNDNIPGSVVRCAILHIAQIEDLQAA